MVYNNPIQATAAATLIASEAEGQMLQGIQWVDIAAADIVDTDELDFTINGVAVNLIVTDVNTQLNGAVAYEVFFPTPIRVYSFVLDGIDGGAIILWLG